MANRQEILEQINIYKMTGQDIVRRNAVKVLHDLTGNDTIIYFSSFPSKYPVPSNILSIDLTDIQGFMSCLNGLHGGTLDLILHSPGGSLEAAEQIVQYLRSKYDHIRAIIPQNAMSAATMISCACDEIILGKESAIGPIDPQMSIQSGGTIASIPAHSILADFETAKEEVKKDPSTSAIWVPKLATIPVGYLDFCSKTIKLSKQKVAEWLNLYMFRDSSEDKGTAIAEWLGDFKEHKTHGRPINYKLASEKGLKVSLLEDNQKLQDAVLSVYHAALVTFEVTGCVKIIENHVGVGSYTTVQTQ